MVKTMCLVQVKRSKRLLVYMSANFKATDCVTRSESTNYKVQNLTHFLTVELSINVYLNVGFVRQLNWNDTASVFFLSSLEFFCNHSSSFTGFCSLVSYSRYSLHFMAFTSLNLIIYSNANYAYKFFFSFHNTEST